MSPVSRVNIETAVWNFGLSREIVGHYLGRRRRSGRDMLPLRKVDHPRAHGISIA